MMQQAANETLHLFVTIGSRTEHGDRVTHVTTQAAYRGMVLARVGDIVTYDDGSEATDTFNSDDVMYGQGIGMKYWAPSDPDGAIRNADSIACYVAHFDKKL